MLCHFTDLFNFSKFLVHAITASNLSVRLINVTMHVAISFDHNYYK